MTIDWEEIAHGLIDSLIEILGIRETIRQLLWLDVTEDQLYEIGFESIDIKPAIEQYKYEKENEK